MGPGRPHPQNISLPNTYPESMQEGDNIWFGTPHIVTLLVLALFGFVLIFVCKKYLDTRKRNYVAGVLGVIMIFVELADVFVRLVILKQPWTENLPFHLCGPIYYMVAVMLITKKRWLYELTYFLGLAGAANSVLTPGEIFPFPHFLNLTFFFTHGMIIIGVLWMTICMEDYRPTWKAFGKTVIFLNLFGAFLIPVNLAFGTNYLFICHKPPGGTLMDLMGPWPLYIFFVELLGLFLCLVAFSPFLVMDLVRKLRKQDV